MALQEFHVGGTLRPIIYDVGGRTLRVYGDFFSDLGLGLRL